MSPLRWFRRHATWMLIIFGVVLMAIFGLGPVFDQMARGFQSAGSAAEDPVLHTYRGGEITRSKLDELQRDHFATRRFLVSLVEQAAKQCEKNEVQYQPFTQMIQPLGRTDDNDAVDEQMLLRKLLADRAEDEGVVISDGMIEDYLKLLAGQAEFSQRDLKQINKLVNQRTGLTTIWKHLKLELKATQMQRYAAVGVPLNPIPTEAMELYARANDRIECEVIPVSVEEYISQVSGSPSDSELRTLFEEGKYNYQNLGMETPGFKEPRKVNVQYFVAQMDTFLENEKSKITDAEVEAEYDRLVEAKDSLVISIVPQPEAEGFNLDLGEDMLKDEGSKDAMDAEGSDKEMPLKEMPAKEMPAKEMPAKEMPAKEMPAKEMPAKEMPAKELPEEKIPGTELPVEPDTLEAVVPKVEMPATEVPATGTPAVEKPVIEKPTGGEGTVIPDAKVEGGSGQSMTIRRSRNQFASFLQDAQEEPAMTAEGLTAEPAAMAQEAQSEPTTDQEVGGLGGLQLSDESAETKKTEIKPLSEVADQIRERLAKKVAFDKKSEAQKRAMISLQTYQNQVLRWEMKRESNKADNTPKPDAPDFAAIAESNGLVFSETGLVDPFELRETEIGKVNFPIQVQSPNGPMRWDLQSISNRVFLDYDRIDLLKPQEVTDMATANAYVFWMAEKMEVRIPDFADAKPAIEKYWKYQQAIELATAAAEKMAATAKNSNGKKLTELFPETAAPTGEFTWFRPGRDSAAIFGTPFEIDQPGEEFMSTAFSLKEGETSVAANQSRDTVYVIQSLTAPTALSELGDEYLKSQYFRFKRVPTDVMGVAQHYAQELEFDWRDEFVESMDLKRMK